MSSISSISNSQSISISAYKGEELSITTKMRLEALGIDPSSVTTEAQAQILIAQAEAATKQNNSGQQQRGGNSTSQQQLLSEAKTLAQTVGVSVSDSDGLEDIIEKISNKLQIMGKDPSKAQMVQTYQSELETLAQKADVVVTRQQNIFNTMEMISLSNKLILGL